MADIYLFIKLILHHKHAVLTVCSSIWFNDNGFMFIHLFLWPFSGTCVLRPPRFVAIIYGTTAAFYLSFTTISHLRTSLEPKGQLYGFFTAVQLFPIFPLLLSHFFSTSFPSLILLFAFFTLNLVLFFFPFVFSSYFTFFHLSIFTV